MWICPYASSTNSLHEGPTERDAATKPWRGVTHGTIEQQWRPLRPESPVERDGFSVGPWKPIIRTGSVAQAAALDGCIILMKLSVTLR
jgi:hypothetical protein